MMVRPPERPERPGRTGRPGPDAGCAGPAAGVRWPSVVRLPRIADARGNLTFVEALSHVPFDIRRVYWVYDVPGGETRGGRAHLTTHEFVIALSGSFDVVLERDGEHRVVPLNRSYVGLHIEPRSWRTLDNFSTNAVCLVLASSLFDEADCVRDYDAFRRLAARGD